jgi:hypothetical protein
MWYPCLREQIQDTIRAAKLTYQWRQVLDPRTQYLSWNTVARFHQQYPLNELSEIVDNDIHFVPVVEIESRFAPVYDLQVPGNHAFLGNCVINHNTVNMPNDATPEDIEQIYMQAWKLGLKAIAIYRDGSKRTQPLSTKKPSEQEAQLPVPTERPIRRHLPDERRSITHKFSIAGHEGYITVGMYEDGTPGEIFITMAKEGSVISGLMDAFATAISLALQYGVPLEKLVEKFSYTPFPAQRLHEQPANPCCHLHRGLYLPLAGHEVSEPAATAEAGVGDLRGATCASCRQHNRSARDNGHHRGEGRNPTQLDPHRAG